MAINLISASFFRSVVTYCVLKLTQPVIPVWEAGNSLPEVWAMGCSRFSVDDLGNGMSA